MRLLFLLILVMVSFLLLHGESADSLDKAVPETVENGIVKATNNDSLEDVFTDKNGDGIADDRTFRERMRTWRRTRTMSDRILSPGNGNSENSGKVGNKAKKGGHEGNNSNNQGNGNGNG